MSQVTVTVTHIIALVFDFDDTLMPDTTSRLLREYSIPTEGFWNKSTALYKEGYDPPSAYLKVLLDDIGEGKPLGKLTNDDLGRFGAALDGDFYPGLPDFFDDVRNSVLDHFKNIEVEFYIISGGLQAILQGSKIVSKYFSGVYGCQLGGDPETGVLTHIKRSITFTEKTRYLFEVNKGIKQADSQANPFLVNEDVKQDERRIPFQNIVYVGDGLTDIPCFSLLKSLGGESFGVFEPGNPEKTKRAYEKFLVPKRVIGMHAPRYGPKDELGAFLRSWVLTRAAQVQLESEMAYKAKSSPI
jgi:hypothetical protein